MASKVKYRVLTWDMEREQFTPQCGVRQGPYTQFGLRKALRRLQTMGYEANRGDNSVLVEEWSLRQEATDGKTRS